MTKLEAFHPVTCPGCGARYDSLAAAWCNCISKEPSLVCEKCGSCFCATPPTFKAAFWERAPRELWSRRQAKRGEMTWTSLASEEAMRPLILIVDDDPMLRRILVAHVRSLGFGAVTAADGLEGLRAAQLYRPELVITDALMPQLDGREMARRIRRTAPATRIVVLTSVYTNALHKHEALHHFGADEYLTKPVEAKVLTEVVQRLLAVHA
jgi:CheY-like chemotaxis protein